MNAEKVKNVVILGIESSCDDTSAAICVDGKITSNVIASQHIHAQYGGVVPELASRAHQKHMVPTLAAALQEANIGKSALSAVAFTNGPGLMGSLLVGASFAKSLALGLAIPIIGVNHLQAHVLSLFIDEPHPNFPFLCLLVSGGHTQIIRVDDFFAMEVIGQSTDDAAGEAFDKAAKLLGLPYPGGVLIDKLSKQGNEHAFSFPEPQVSGFDYSFSGLKTALLYFLKQRQQNDPTFIEKHLNDICASFQKRIVDFLLEKLQKASRFTGIKEIAIAGGVSANSRLRDALQVMASNSSWKVYVPKPKYCTDNGAMVAMTGYFRYQRNLFDRQDMVTFSRA